jgi:hypothetical protein
MTITVGVAAGQRGAAINHLLILMSALRVNSGTANTGGIQARPERRRVRPFVAGE